MRLDGSLPREAPAPASRRQPASSVANRALPYQLPVRYLGHGLYSDATGASLSYLQVSEPVKDLASVQRAHASRVGPQRVVGVGAATIAIGGFATLIAAGSYAVRRGDYNWDLEQHESDVAWCENDPFFCSRVGSPPTEPELVGLLPSLAITGAGAMITFGGALALPAHKRRMARVINRDVGGAAR